MNIQDDFELFELIVADAKNSEGIYKPGPYWLNQTKSAINEIRKYGIRDFRGSKSGVATSYGDNVYVDTRNNYNFGLRSILLKVYRDLYPFNKLFDSQVNLTSFYFEEARKYKNEFLLNNERVKYLLENYNFNFDSTTGGCLNYGEFSGKRIAFHYLQLLDTLDHIDQKINKEFL
jgi:hypothetical protein